MADEQRAQRLEREQVLSEYGTWRLTADADAPVGEEIRTLEVAGCRVSGSIATLPSRSSRSVRTASIRPRATRR